MRIHKIDTETNGKQKWLAEVNERARENKKNGEWHSLNNNIGNASFFLFVVLLLDIILYVKLTDKLKHKHSHPHIKNTQSISLETEVHAIYAKSRRGLRE